MRILIVDDDPHILRALQRALRAHRPVAALGGVMALEVVEVDRDFDVILCDIHMPTMGGAELHATIARALPELAERMLFMTGGLGRDEDVAFLQGRAHLRKPFAFDELERQLTAIAAKTRAARNGT